MWETAKTIQIAVKRYNVDTSWTEKTSFGTVVVVIWLRTKKFLAYLKSCTDVAQRSMKNTCRMGTLRLEEERDYDECHPVLLAHQ